ncbi:hypothetical protein [Streptomyces mirabilis]|uniref:hypothetical protein n=1 Tax=Streptomyces mirabilis TaxID=68239 RepID=UPI0036C9E4E9
MLTLLRAAGNTEAQLPGTVGGLPGSREVNRATQRSAGMYTRGRAGLRVPALLQHQSVVNTARPTVTISRSCVPPTFEGHHVALNPLQSSLDEMTEYLRDAILVHRVTQERLDQKTAARQAQGKGGNGQPGKEHSALNRATVVAAVGALEAFNEDLAITAQRHHPQANPPLTNWYNIAGSKGMVQTPSTFNLRKLFWTFFRYDPQDDWDWVVQVASIETGGTGTWRTATTQLAKAQASQFLDTMVKVRHGFAHQDKDQKLVQCPGIASQTASGKIVIHSHHATNALSVLMQYAVLTTTGLANRLGFADQFRWVKPMSAAGWETLLAGTPAGTLVSQTWNRAPVL